MKSPDSRSKICALAVTAYFLSACVPLIEKAAETAAKRQSEKTYKLYIARRDEFAYCLDHPGGMCSLPENGGADDPFADKVGGSNRPSYSGWALVTHSPSRDANGSVFADELAASNARDVGRRAAADALNNPLLHKLNIVHMASSGSDINDEALVYIDKFADVESEPQRDGSTTYKYDIPITLKEIETFQDSIETATLLDGWSALQAEGDSAIFADDESGALDDDIIRRSYVKAYLEAYFRGGKPLELKIDVGQLRTSILDKLKDELPGLDDETYTKIVDGRLEAFGFKAGTEQFLSTQGDQSFVTRDGQAVQFPGYSASVNLGSSEVEHSDIDYIAVGTDLIRVFLHAVFDSRQRIPAVSNATGVTELDPPFALTANDPDRVSETQFQKIQTRANQVEGVVAAGTGRLIRGISVLALNNEALATAIETSVGLAVRKQTEKILYCWYSCGPGQGNEDLLADYEATSSGDLIELKIRLTE